MDKTILSLLEKVAPLGRVHVGEETDLSLKILKDFFPQIHLHEFPTGQKWGGWEVTPAWNIKKGILKRMNGEILADAKKNPLFLYAYSQSFSGSISRKELLDHVLTNEHQPQGIPFHFRLQYRPWEKNWGFCLPFETVQKLSEDTYRVDIETEFVSSTMKVAEYVLTGETDRTILLSGHWDHPAMLNDGLLGCLATLEIMEHLRRMPKRQFTYRAVFTPEFVGSAFYLEKQKSLLKNVIQGLFIAAPGANGPLVFQQSRSGTSLLDRYLPEQMREKGISFDEAKCQEVMGNDEIVYESPGYEIPMPSLVRFPFPEYHTSLDTLKNSSEKNYDEVVNLVIQSFEKMEKCIFPKRTFDGYICLGHPSIDLYLPPRTMSQKDTSEEVNQIYRSYSHDFSETFDGNLFCKEIWHFLNGKLSLEDLSRHFNISTNFLKAYLKKAEQKGLVEMQDGK